MRAGSEAELRLVSTILGRLLEADFPDAATHRDQLGVATLRRHDTGCAIEVDRSLVEPAVSDPQMPGAKLPVEAHGHGKLWIMLHGWRGYLDDVELVSATLFPAPSTLKISVK